MWTSLYRSKSNRTLGRSAKMLSLSTQALPTRGVNRAAIKKKLQTEMLKYESGEMLIVSLDPVLQISREDTMPPCTLPSVDGFSWANLFTIDVVSAFSPLPTERKRDSKTNGHMSLCAGCNREIVDRFILRVHPNLEFHASCLKCFDCCRSLDENCTAFVRDQRTYCKDDYLRLFGTKCARCALYFERNEMVMRARSKVYHMNCFTCVACERKLRTGDEFQIKGESLYCRADCEAGNMPEPSTVTSTFLDDDSWETSTMTSLDPATSPPLSVRSPKSEDMSTPQNGFYGTPSSGGSAKKKKDKQTTRVRTVLNEGQLNILKKCYAMNSRPDAMIKEQLVELTGLNARVIRVWFQNKRCKDKKRQIQLRDFQVNAEKERALNSVRMSGIGPLMAVAPTTHVDPTLGGPIDITSYPQWPQSMDPINDAAYGSHMSYTELGAADLNFGMVATAPFTDYSPHLHASDLSSPSCSE